MFKVISKQFKVGCWQITRIIDNFGVEKIQVRCYKRIPSGYLDFKKYQEIYAHPKDWDELKKAIRKTKKN